jgi:hypothetical protein
MDETTQERLEQLRLDNVETLRRAGHLIIANEDLALQLAREVLGAPNDAFARNAVSMAVTLIAEMANYIRRANIGEMKKYDA